MPRWPFHDRLLPKRRNCRIFLRVSDRRTGVIVAALKDDTVAIVAEEVPKRERSSEIWGTWRFGLVPRLRKLALLGVMCS